MAQEIKQNGIVILSSQMEFLCPIVFNNLTGGGIESPKEYENYLNMMFYDFPELTYGEIELWQNGELKKKGNIKQI